MQASKWEIVADENEGELPSGMLARFVTGSRVAGIDCGVVAVKSRRKTGMGFRIRERTCDR